MSDRVYSVIRPDAINIHEDLMIIVDVISAPSTRCKLCGSTSLVHRGHRILETSCRQRVSLLRSLCNLRAGPGGAQSGPARGPTCCMTRNHRKHCSCPIGNIYIERAPR